MARGAPTGNYPAFQIGVTGIDSKVEANKVVVTKITAGSPAEGKFQAGDILVSVGGKAFGEAKVESGGGPNDPRLALGRVIDKAEGGDGKLTFGVEREGKTSDVTIQLKPIGSYSKTWPLGCNKSSFIIEQTAEFILSVGPQAGFPGYMDGLFLLSTGIPKYTEAAARWAKAFSTGKVGSHTWNNGYHGVFLCEYYLATGDKSVLPTIKALCDDATARQYFGGWNHWGPGMNPGYVQGGLLNAAGVQVLTTLILARECGVEVNQDSYDKALAYFYRFAGHGGVSYGNQPPEGIYSNGKNGMLACALTLLPDQKFQRAARILALAEADTYDDNEGGHGSHFGNVMWRGIASVLVPNDKQAHYRRHMDYLAWYYDMCRLPDGGFSILTQIGGSRRGCNGPPNYDSGMIGLTYTAPLKTLRITGKPRTPHSVKHQPTAVEKGLEDTDFLRSDFVNGITTDLSVPEIYARLAAKQDLSVEWYWQMMHHYQPSVRQSFAVAMGDSGKDAIPYILKAVQSKDARLREAGFNAIHGMTGWWFYRQSKANGITEQDVTGTFLPYILKTIQTKDAPMWEKTSALWALSKADLPTIKDSLALIKSHLTHDEWLVRVAAWQALSPLDKDPATLKTVLPDLLECYAQERITHPTRSMRGYLSRMHTTIPELSTEILAGMTGVANSTPISSGYKAPIDEGVIFEAFRFIDAKKRPENALLMVPAAQRLMKNMDGLQAIWLFTGDRWGNAGLLNCANQLGEKAKPIIAGFKAMRPDIEAKVTGRHKAQMEDVLKKVDSCIADYEAKYGRVEAASPVE
ncbi:MAG: DUF6288 domain-containing protein [Luteolibacter sp.]